MNSYFVAIRRHGAAATYDVVFVAFLSLAPLLLARFVLLVVSGEDFWAFIFNGQISYFTMGSLATLLLYCFKKNLPGLATLVIGPLALLCVMILVVFVGIDPTLEKGKDFLGPYAIYLYVFVIVVRIIAEAIKNFEYGDAFQASTMKSDKQQQMLTERMKVGS